MTTTQLIIVLVVVVALIAVLAMRSGGPRVTEITRTVRRDEEDNGGSE